MPKVLIVDDEPDQLASLAKILQVKGHQVATAPNGREALTQVMDDPPDVVVLDILMPEMDGPSFLEVVRSYLRLQSLPVVILTGVPDSPLAARTSKAKVKSFLVKGRATSEDIQKAIDDAISPLPP